MDILWERLTEIYGHKWTSSYGEIPNKTWINGLLFIDPENIKKGLTELLKNKSEWPPSLPEFINLCLNNNIKHAINSQMYKAIGNTILDEKGTIALREQTESSRSESISDIRKMLR